MLARRLGTVASDQASSTSYTSIHVSTSTFHSSSGSHNALALVFAIAAGAVVVVAVILVLLLLHRKWETSSRADPSCDGEPALELLKRFSYSELRAATGRFSDACKLGQGGFGTVFKGILEDGREIAIKRLDTSSLQGENEFQNEISVLGRLSSPYIVGLVGYCAEGQKKLLVYDLMENGSLQEALFGKSNAIALDWEMRYKIMVDIAYALAFLHSDCDPPVIHGDIKPSNVLLDANFTARIADFGLARFKYEDDTTVLSGRLSLTRDKTNCEKSNAEAREGRRKMGNLKEEEIVVVDRNPTQEEEEILECGNEISFSSTELCQEDQKATSESISQEMKTPAMVDAADACKASPSVDEDETALYGWGKIGQSEELKSEISQISGTEEHLTGSKRNRRLEEYGFGEFILGCVACHSGTGIPVGRDLTAATQKENSGNGNYKATARKEEKRRRVKAGSLEWWKECDGDTNSKEFKKRLRNQLKSKITKNRELSLTESREIKKADSDWWKEDSRNDSCKSMSAESFTFDFSGELNHSMELACHGRGFAKTASREWWSGDLSKGREWWSGEFSSCKKEKNAQGYSWSRELSEDQNQGKKLGRYGSRSTDGWSGDLLSRGMSSTPSMRGTVCYVAPEYTGGGILSEKSDVYSYGVLMLVIISGRRPLQVISSPIHELERANLISWARQAAMAGTMLDLVDGSLQDDFCRDQACFCITLALLCLQKIPSSRPTMQDVVRYLTGEVELPSLPFEFLPSPTGGISPLKPGRKPLVDQNAGQMPIAL